MRRRPRRQLERKVVGQDKVGNAPEAGDAKLEVLLQRFGALCDGGQEHLAGEVDEDGAVVERHARDAAPRACSRDVQTTGWGLSDMQQNSVQSRPLRLQKRLA